MYDYISFKPNQKEVTLTPSDNLNINGTPLNELVDGYQQLSVSGRGILSDTPNTTPVPMRDGVWFNYTQTEPRTLTIQYQLEAKTSEELRLRFNALNKALRTGQETLDVTFDDESEWHYYAYLSNGGNFTENKLVIVSEFELFCPSSFAYKTAESGTTVNLEYADEVLPERIELVAESGDTVELVNTKGDRLVFNGSYASGQRLELVYHKDHISFERDGLNITTDLAMFSFPETLTFRDGDTLSVTGAMLSLIEWRDKKR